MMLEDYLLHAVKLNDSIVDVCSWWDVRTEAFLYSLHSIVDGFVSRGRLCWLRWWVGLIIFWLSLIFVSDLWMNEIFVFRELNWIAARTHLPIQFQIMVATVNRINRHTHGIETRFPWLILVVVDSFDWDNGTLIRIQLDFSKNCWGLNVVFWGLKKRGNLGVTSSLENQRTGWKCRENQEGETNITFPLKVYYVAFWLR